MKRKLFLPVLGALLLSALFLKAQVLSDDYQKVLDSGNKRIVVKEINDKQRIDVEVYEVLDDDELLPYEKIFEGHYRDGISSEQRKYLMSIDIPSPIKKRKFEDARKCRLPHHDAAFGVGFAGFADEGDKENVPFRYSSSPEISLTVYRKAVALSRNNQLGLVTGLGIRWVRYHLKGNQYFEEVEDETKLIPGDDSWDMKKSKLGITTLNVPLLLEWKTRNRNLFLSAGAVCSFKTASSSRIYYKDARGKKQSEKVDQGMTLRPVTVDMLVQAGTRDIGIYARYSPVSIFEKSKGPELYPLTVGVMFYFD